MSEMIELPGDPNPAIDVILAKMGGADVPLGELLHAGVHLQGYAVGKIHTHPVVGSCPCDDLATELKKLKTYGAGPGDAAAIPWKPLLGMLLQALAQWLAAR